MAPTSSSGDFYHGSRVLMPLTGVLGLSIDQVNFLVCQLVALALGFPFRTLLHPKTAGTQVRHIVELTIGAYLVYFCFGQQILILLGHATMGYILIQFYQHKWMPWVTFGLAMGYLAVAHTYRMVLDYGGYTLDITGPIMLSVQKITLIAWGLHDGLKKEGGSPLQKKNSIKAMPSILEYYSYIFCFHGVMCGPLVFYNEYLAFIDGSNFSAHKKDDNKEDPSPVEVMGKKLLVVLILGALMMIEPMVAPWQRLYDDDFLYNTTFIYRTVYLVASMSMHRPMYYFAWKLGEVVNNSAGLGFEGYDDEGKPKWGLLNNVYIWNLEVSNSLKVNVDSWNTLTSIWLRYTVYDRVPAAYGTWIVFLLSAFWHGFYPGYYIAFMTGALFTTAARLIRRNIRPHFQTSDQHKFFYDCVTFTFTRIANSLMVVPFVLLEIQFSLTFYNALYWWLHIGSALVILYYNVLAKFLRPAKGKGEKSSLKQDTDTGEKSSLKQEVKGEKSQ